MFQSRPRYLEIAPAAIWRSVCVKGGGKLEGAVRLVVGGGHVEGLEDPCEFIGVVREAYRFDALRS